VSAYVRITLAAHHGACPLCPRKRTSIGATEMSASCQSRHNAMRHLRRPEIACTKSLYFAQKALPWWSFMCKAPCGEGEEYSRKIGWQASGPLTRLARLCVLCVLATLSRKERGCCGRAAPAFAPPACGTITTMRLSPHSPYYTARTIDPGTFARFTIDPGSTRASLRARCNAGIGPVGTIPAH